jgi:predicted RecB family nuclease
MRITSPIFDAFLKCVTKCHLRSLGEIGSGNEYAEWVRGRDESYQREAVRRLQEAVPETERAVAPPAAENLKAVKWRLAVDLAAQTPYRTAETHVRESPPNEGTSELGAACSEQLLESRLHAVERVPSEGRGKPTQFVPIRFVFRNKLTKDDRLLLAFDALVLSQVLRREVSVGKIIYGDDHATLKVKTSCLAGEVRKRLEKLAVLLSIPAPLELILNRHCAECEFQARCRKTAIEKDDLSLLAGMSVKERKKLHSKGIFTVTQLSYTFRPRRRPKRLRDKREKYHHSLKALAIREKKVHIVGSPEFKFEGTPVYLDVEGLPDRDFYYLIGLRIGHGESAVQHSLGADSDQGEGKIWCEFLAILETVEKPVLIHYGSYETRFLKTMCERYGQPAAESVVAQAIKSAVNILSLIFARVYFPKYSNGLKEIAGYLGFLWSDPNASGLKAIIWRHEWEQTKSSGLKEQLLTYNVEDCRALESVVGLLMQLGESSADQHSGTESDAAVVHTELMPHQTMFPRFSSPLPEFEQANKAARWDYQRERIYVRSSKRIRKIRNQQRRANLGSSKSNETIVINDKPPCPKCGRSDNGQHKLTKMLLYDLRFGKHSLRKWVVEYRFPLPWCGHCHIRHGLPKELWPGSNCGRSLSAYVVYQCVELYIPQLAVERSLTRLFGFHFGTHAQIHRLKVRAAEFYAHTRQLILDRIVGGNLVHVDETRANIKGKAAYVWVFTSLQEVVYLYSESREGEIAQATLANFKGVLVSDFYSAYDSLSCPQQKCLLHLMRDLNAEILRNPYDEELKQMISGFAQLLKQAVETVDRFGLKKHFLHKHHRSVDRLYRQIALADPQSEVAIKCKQRFEKNRGKLFAFLDYDGVPWNNNNAEHAIKAFAALRRVMQGSSTQKGIEDYLILLSVCQTCKYMGVDFLDFLRSGEKDIHAFAESRRGRRRQPPTSLPEGLREDAGPAIDRSP